MEELVTLRTEIKALLQELGCPTEEIDEISFSFFHYALDNALNETLNPDQKAELEKRLATTDFDSAIAYVGEIKPANFGTVFMKYLSEDINTYFAQLLLDMPADKKASAEATINRLVNANLTAKITDMGSTPADDVLRSLSN